MSVSGESNAVRLPAMTIFSSSKEMADRCTADPVVLTNAQIFDGEQPTLLFGRNVYLKNGRIAEISSRPATPDDGIIVDCAGRTMMPGLIDAHVHAYALSPNVYEIANAPMSLKAAWAIRMLGRMLDRGFTTVRDTGGADFGLAMALRRGWIRGPRLFYCGLAISQSGGHGDLRNPELYSPHDEISLSCGCAHFNSIGVVIDGVNGVRRAARENLHRGASFIKIMASGGVASTSDHLTSIQFSDEEITAIVDEVERKGAYCTAHAHTDNAIRRALNLGVHCIEHGTLIEGESARMAADKGTAVVPTLAPSYALALEGRDLGLPPQAIQKLERVKDYALDGLMNLKAAGGRIGFGTDLLGQMEIHQSIEFKLRSPIFSPYELLKQATSINADLMGAKNDLGIIKVGAIADIILMNGNPLVDIDLMANGGAAIHTVIQNGHFL